MSCARPTPVSKITIRSAVAVKKQCSHVKINSVYLYILDLLLSELVVKYNKQKY